MLEYLIAGQAYRCIEKIAASQEKSVNFTLRFFCKQTQTDVRVGLSFDSPPQNTDILHKIFKHIPLETLSKFPLTLQVINEKIDNADIFYSLTKTISELHPAILSIKSNDMFQFARFVGIQISKNFSVEIFEQKLFWRSLRPPHGFLHYLTKLNFPILQDFMNYLFKESLVNHQMLAAYFKSIDTKEQILLKALSKQNRAEIIKLMDKSNQNLHWINQTEYLIYHNLYRYIIVNNKRIQGLEAWQGSIQNYKLIRFEHALSRKSFFERLKEDLSKKNYTLLKQKITGQKWTYALSTLSEAELKTLLNQHISKKGLKLLSEDCKAVKNMAKQHDILAASMDLLGELLHIKWATHIKSINMIELTEKLITNSAKANLLTHEAGIHSTFALLDQMPKEWKNNHLSGSLKTLYEDVKHKNITLNFHTPPLTEENIKLLLLKLRLFALI